MGQQIASSAKEKTSGGSAPEEGPIQCTREKIAFVDSGGGPGEIMHEQHQCWRVVRCHLPAGIAVGRHRARRLAQDPTDRPCWGKRIRGRHFYFGQGRLSIQQGSSLPGLKRTACWSDGDFRTGPRVAADSSYEGAHERRQNPANSIRSPESKRFFRLSKMCRRPIRFVAR